MRHAQKKGVSYSAMLHAAIFLLAVVGLPSFLAYRELTEPTAITVEILPISEMSNLKPSPEPPAPKEEAAKNQKPAPPTRKEEMQEKKIEEKPSDFVKKEEKKPEEKKEKKSTEEDLMAVLKSVRESAQKTPDKPKETAKEESTSTTKSTSDSYNPDLPLSVSEKDAIRSQLAKCWNVPAGAKNAHELVVLVRVEVARDGNVTKAVLTDDSKSRYASDSFFRAAADSAIRAVRQCSPLKNLPPDKYDTWRDMELTFDPKDMLF